MAGSLGIVLELLWLVSVKGRKDGKWDSVYYYVCPFIAPVCIPSGRPTHIAGTLAEVAADGVSGGGGGT